MDDGDDKAARRVAGKAQVDVRTLVQPALDELCIDRWDFEHGRIAQNATRSLIVMSGAPGVALISRRSAKKPVASAEACSVYWAVVASDSPMRRAILCAHARETDRWRHKVVARIMPPKPDPAPADLITAVHQPASGACDRRGGPQLGANVPLQDAPTRPAARQRRRVKAVLGGEPSRPRAHAADRRGDVLRRRCGLVGGRSARSPGSSPVRDAVGRRRHGGCRGERLGYWRLGTSADRARRRSELVTDRTGVFGR